MYKQSLLVAQCHEHEVKQSNESQVKQLIACNVYPIILSMAAAVDASPSTDLQVADDTTHENNDQDIPVDILPSNSPPARHNIQDGVIFAQ